MSDPLVDELTAKWPIPATDLDAWDQRDRAVAAQRARENAGAEILRMQHRATLLRANHFPDEHLAAAVAKLVETVSLKHTRTFEMLPAKILVLAGSPGTGKTLAATWAALRREDSAPAFVRSGELERSGRYDPAMKARLKESTSLVLDDLGVEYLDAKGVYRSLLDELIDRYYADRATLIITTNLCEADLAERFGARAASRFKQRGVWANCGMQDLRKGLP